MSTNYPNACAGSMNVVVSKVNSSGSVEVTFPDSVQFSGSPTVVCSLNDAGPNFNVAFLTSMAWQVTQNGFKAVVKLNSGAPELAYDVTVLFNYVAMEASS